ARAQAPEVDSALTLLLEPGVLLELYQARAEFFRQYWSDFQDSFYAETGLKLPDLAVRAAEFTSSPRYQVLYNGTVIVSGKILLDGIVVETNPDNAAPLGIDVAMEIEHPMTGARVFWAHHSPILSRILEAAEIRALDFMQYISLRIA